MQGRATSTPQPSCLCLANGAKGPAIQYLPDNSSRAGPRRALRRPYAGSPRRRQNASLAPLLPHPLVVLTPIKQTPWPFSRASAAVAQLRALLFPDQNNTPTMKRKRRPSDHDARAPSSPPEPTVAHPVLQRFYPQVLPLRQFLLSRLARASTRKRRRIAQLGLVREPTAAPGAGDDLRRLLDATWVGTAQHTAPAELADLESDLEIFSQQLPSTSSASDICSELQSEVGPSHARNAPLQPVPRVWKSMSPTAAVPAAQLFDHAR